jgi:hypothetical protein
MLSMIVFPASLVAIGVFAALLGYFSVLGRRAARTGGVLELSILFELSVIGSFVGGVVTWGFSGEDLNQNALPGLGLLGAFGGSMLALAFYRIAMQRS